MQVWEFNDVHGNIWRMTERQDKQYDLGIVTFKRVEPDWDELDRLQREGVITFAKQYEIQEK